MKEFYPPIPRIIEKYEENTMKVYGEGEIKVKPDRASIVLGVKTLNKDVKKAQSENAAISNKLIRNIKKLGISEENLQTERYNIRESYDYNARPKKFEGFEVEHMYRIVVEDLDMIGEVIEVGVSSGANIASNISFFISNYEKYYNQALEKAMESAYSKSNTLSKSINTKIKFPPSVVEEKYSIIQPRQFDGVAMAKGNTPIEVGQVVVQASVEVVFNY